jgi:uncharacterized protein YdaU (DUF1376 family)
MSRDHWMRFNVGDYLADTMHLSTLQHGAYLLLVMHYFKRGGLPEEEASLARIAHMALPRWRRHCQPVLALFRRENDHWTHRRIDAERARMQLGEPPSPARASPGETSEASSHARVPEPKLKLVKGARSARPPSRGGFSHNIIARRAAGAD